MAIAATDTAATASSARRRDAPRRPPMRRRLRGPRIRGGAGGSCGAQWATALRADSPTAQNGAFFLRLNPASAAAEP